MDLEEKRLMNELTQGRELANQLKNQIGKTSSPQTCELLLEKILSSYENSLSMLNWSGLVGEPLESTPSLSGSSPKSENSGHDSKDQCRKDVFKKRKLSLPRWSKQVRVYAGTGLEGPLDDGYSWRKYGQKEILGANFPRAYYRCTHRNGQGCLATKQVQKSDKDPSIFEITYRGRHTCIQSSHLIKASASLGKAAPKENKTHFQPQQEEIQKQVEEEIMFNFGTSLKTEELGNSEEIFPSFYFPSTPLHSEIVEPHFFPESMRENNFLGDFSTTFISPETSDSNYFSLNSFGLLGHNLQSSDSDLTDIISAPTSVTNSPIGDLDFSIGQVDFGTNFPFDIPDFFP